MSCVDKITNSYDQLELPIQSDELVVYADGTNE